MIKDRIYWLDYLRAMACFLVIVVHLPEFSSSYLDKFYTYISRVGVPLFFIISGYLTLPFDSNLKEVFSKRLPRLVYPFLIWSVIYAFIPFLYADISLEECFVNLLNIPIKLTASHLWYMYGIIGLYLFAPLISPWLKQASKNEIQFYLALWVISLFFVYLLKIIPTIKMDEWNSIFTLFYFSGYLGYFILGFYVRKFSSEIKSNKEIYFAIIAMTISFFILLISMNVFKTNAESTKYLSINVALLSVSIFLIFKNVAFRKNKITDIIVELSQKSFGIYLIHEFISKYILFRFFEFTKYKDVLYLRPALALVILIVSYLAVVLITKIPKSKYIIG